MNLIEKFENMPFQDVGTFNSIFKKTPIMGFNFNESVEIGSIQSGQERKITVGKTDLLIDLSQNVIKEPTRKVSKVKKNSVKKESSKELPKIYSLLNPIEFMIFYALKELGKVDGISELSRKLNLTTKTVRTNLKKLTEHGFVKIQHVNGFNRIFIDTTNTI